MEGDNAGDDRSPHLPPLAAAAVAAMAAAAASPSSSTRPVHLDQACSRTPPHSSRGRALRIGCATVLLRALPLTTTRRRRPDSPLLRLGVKGRQSWSLVNLPKAKRLPVLLSRLMVVLGPDLGSWRMRGALVRPFLVRLLLGRPLLSASHPLSRSPTPPGRALTVTSGLKCGASVGYGGTS
ncbi:unnamed protein product [Urochloa humidicola]